MFFFVFELQARTRQTDGQTDGRARPVITQTSIMDDQNAAAAHWHSDFQKPFLQTVQDVEFVFWEKVSVPRRIISDVRMVSQ